MTQEQALNILKTGASVFLTGEPGSGKTYTVNSYISWLKKHQIHPSITASTGIAATHIGGQTIHSYSGIGIADNLSKYDIDRIASNEKISRRISAANVLIIDEISMLDSGKMQMVDAIFREVKNSEMPFGGIQVILVGDFFQLPPVARENKIAAYAFESAVWQQLNPVVCYITEQHRQEDQVFLGLLNAIRRSTIEEEHYDIVSSRRIDFRNAPTEIPKLFSHNIDVDRINAQELSKLPGDNNVFHMSSKGSKGLVEQLKRGCLSPENLELKKNAQVMFTKNSQQGRFVNGTLGVVIGFDSETKFPIVKLKNGNKIIAVPVKWSIEDRGRILAAIEQIPLRLAWAMTVHKSQGMSMDAAVMDLSGAFEYGQGYVALSRVRKLSGLHLSGMNQRALMVHPLILAKDVEFRDLSETAETSLLKILPELISLHEKFIRASGGNIEEIKEEVELKSGFDEIRKTHPNAYKSWDEDQEKQLRESFSQNSSISELAKLFGRKPGGITSRLKKLGLIEE